MERASASLLRLNLETQSHHATADQGWVELLAPDITRWQYIRRLTLVYGFEAPVEAVLAYTPNLRLVVDVRRRFRAGLIAQDLLVLGLRASEIAQLPQCLPSSPFGSPLEALGWLYVIERATLLHDAVRRNLLVRIPDALDACAYLAANEGSIGSRWQEFGHVLDRVVRNERMMSELVHAAHAAFRTLNDWCRDDRRQNLRCW